MASKFVAFFATENGKKTSAWATAIAIAAGIFGKYLPNGQFKEWKRDNFYQLYKHSIPVEVPSSVKEKLELVKKDLKLKPDVAEKVSCFTSLGFDPCSFGCAKYRAGALIGIPANFAYNTPEDVDKNIMVGFKTVHWTSPDGMALRSSLVLSDAAKKFALAREVCSVNSQELALQCGLNFAAIFTYYYLAYSFNRKGNMFARPLKLRVVLYSLLGSITFVMWLMVKDFLAVRRDGLADEEAASISEEYAKGGLEFYNKILQRNVAIRSLLGDDGPKQFTALGNTREVFRTTHLPIVNRRDRAVERCKKLAEKKEKASVSKAA